jgi:DNA-binding transcriptional ArsR family regulator
MKWRRLQVEKKLKILQRANLVDEAFLLLYYFINKDDMEATFDRYANLQQNNIEDYNEKYHIIHPIYTDVKSHFSDRKDRIEYLFKARNAGFMTYSALSILWDFQDYNNQLVPFAQAFGSMEEEKKVQSYAGLIDAEEYLNTSKEKLCNLTDLIAFLESSSFENEVKWEIMKIFNNQEVFYNEVSSLLAETIELIVSRHQDSIRKLEEAFYEYWSDFQKENDIIETIKEKLSISWERRSAGTILVPHIFQPYCVALSMDAEDPSKPEVLRIGVMMNKNFIITGKRIKKEDIVNIGKLLGDKSKVDILELAGRKPFYGKELANELQLSTATISYHVNSLLNEGLLKAEVNANKVFYSLNREVLAAYIEDLKNYFLK